MKKGTVSYIGKIILMTVAVFVILFLFRNTASAGVSSIDPITAETSLMACKQGYIGIGADPDKTCTPKTGDADGDCYPDSCDNCPDVHNELVEYQSLRTAILSGYSSADIASEKIKELLGDIGTSQDDPDVDKDLIPNICEATRTQVFLSVKKVWNFIKEDEIEPPFKDGKTASCKFWYSHTQCCAQKGSSVKAYGINGEATGFSLERPCVDHDKRPGK